MRVFHYNDEEKLLHRYLAKRGHANVVLNAADDPMALVHGEPFDAAFVGLHPHGLRLMRALHQCNPIAS
jgi:hypothetical protein